MYYTRDILGKGAAGLQRANWLLNVIEQKLQEYWSSKEKSEKLS